MKGNARFALRITSDAYALRITCSVCCTLRIRGDAWRIVHCVCIVFVLSAPCAFVHSLFPTAFSACWVKCNTCCALCALCALHALHAHCM